jgi:WhiB family transcriptional regulator, redox-sensing transcriptional regulator
VDRSRHALFDALMRLSPNDLEADELLIGQRPGWHQRAACRGQDPALFFGEGSSYKPTAARAICATCPVQRQCLDAGLSERFGVWAGTSPGQRAKLRRVNAA